MTKRIFVAITISEKLQKEILEWEEKWRGLPVRWLRGKNLHITLIPPWDEENVESVKGKIKTIENRLEPFRLMFDKVRFGPNGEFPPRLIWAEGKTPLEITALQNLLGLVLGRDTGVSRSFLLHLTLARFNPDKFNSFPVKKIDEEVKWEENIDSVVLMESNLLPKGADYRVLEKIKLHRWSAKTT